MTIEAMKQARDFISRLKFADAEPEPEIVMAVLDQAIAEAEKQEPIFYVIQATDRFGEGYEQTYWEDPNGFPVYAAPVLAIDISQERVDETAKHEHEWVGLTDEEFEEYAHWIYPEKLIELENLLKEKNT